MPLSTIFQLYRDGQVLMVDETGVPWENHWPAVSHWWSSFIGGWNRSTLRKSLTCRKSLTNFIT